MDTCAQASTHARMHALTHALTHTLRADQRGRIVPDSAQGRLAPIDVSIDIPRAGETNTITLE